MYIDLCYKIHSNWVKINKLNHIVYTVYNLDNQNGIGHINLIQ